MDFSFFLTPVFSPGEIIIPCTILVFDCIFISAYILKNKGDGLPFL